MKFEFLDISTLLLRHRRCQDELRLNRRLAPDVYVAVLPVTRDISGELKLGGRGDVIDWVAQMKRLPAEKALDVMLRDRKLVSKDASVIAQHLTKFYAGLPPVTLTPESSRQALGRHIRANGSTLLEALPHERTRIQRV